GSLTGDRVLAVFSDDADAASGRVHAVTGWEHAQLADPADDFAALVDEAEPAAVETVVEAYAYARAERPDRHLLVRARLAAELGSVSRLLAALGRDDAGAVEVLTTRLHRLDEAVGAAELGRADQRRASLTAVDLRDRRVPRPPPEPADGVDPSSPPVGGADSRASDDAPQDTDADQDAGGEAAHPESGDAADAGGGGEAADPGRGDDADPEVTPSGGSPRAG
ncbi:MAG: macrolide 2'-phosphotransferase, partial [Phycicoccus sp.]